MRGDSVQDDIRDELHELREQNDREIQALEAALPAPAEREGSAADGLVTVRVGPEGDIRDVRVAHDWRSRVSDDELGGVVVEALVRAQSAVVVEFAENTRDLEDVELPRARPMPTPVDTGESFGRTGLIDPAEADRIIGELFAEMEQAFARAEASLDGFAARTGSARSAGGEVLVEIGASGDVSRLELDPRWLSRAHPANIGRLVQSTLREAQSGVLAGLGEVDAAARSVQEMARQLGNPDTLARRFGLQQ